MEAVNHLIRERMQSDVAVIPALADHLIAAGGKRLRPLLTIASAHLALTKSDLSPSLALQNAARLAAAVEFIHTATLLHDDVVDGSELRRGKVAAHLIWGAASSVLVGDFLFARAFELMVETKSLTALGILAKASSVIAEGEVLQLTRSRDIGLNLDTYMQIIKAKTAELFAAASESGAVAAGVAHEDVAALRAYGLHLGLAFQLVDDVLDYGGTAESLGKNAGDDFREGKVTLPLLLAIERSSASEKAFWDRVLVQSKQTDADFDHALSIIRDTKALTDSIAQAQAEAEKAKAALGGFANGPWRQALSDLADFAVSRTK